MTSSINEKAAEGACHFRAEALSAGDAHAATLSAAAGVAVGVCLQLEPPSAGSPRDHKEQGAPLVITHTAYEQEVNFRRVKPEILGLHVTQQTWPVLTNTGPNVC